MKTKLILSGILIAAGVLTFVKTAHAYRGDASIKGPNYTYDRHVAMEKAFDTNDYDAWKNLMQGRGKVSRVITKDNFSKFAQMHSLYEHGNTVEANKVKAELGLGNKGVGDKAGCMKNGQHKGWNK